LELGESITAVNRISAARLCNLSGQITPANLPPSTDWWHVPDVMAGPILPAGSAPVKSETKIGRDLALYHDCRTPCLAIRQFHETDGKTGATFGLKLDVFEFDGSFLSLVVQPPETAIEGLLKSHLIRMSLCAQSELPIEISVRLNIKNGPNTEQVSHDTTCCPDGSNIDFDLEYMPFKEGRATQMWFDLFLKTPPMNLITITEITLSRHLRAAL